MASIGELKANQDALNAIAGDTSSRALRSTNFFDRWVSAFLKRISNYYVIAWRPEKDEEKTQKFLQEHLDTQRSKKFVLAAGSAACSLCVERVLIGFKLTNRSHVRDQQHRRGACYRDR